MCEYILGLTMDTHGYSARHIIFHRLYLVKVRNIESMDKDYILKYGLPYTGIKDIDQQYARGLVDKYVTIAQMAQWHSEGVGIRISKQKDLQEIYYAIQQHIKDFKNYISQSINVNTVPVEDLKKLSDFAKEIYPHLENKPNYQEETEVFGIKDSESYFDIDKIFKPVDKNKEDKVKEKIDVPKAPHEEDMEEIIDKTLYRRQDWLRQK